MSLPEVIADPKKGRRSDDQKLIFISGGMAVEDVGWGFSCYQEAHKKTRTEARPLGSTILVVGANKGLACSPFS